MNTAMLDWEDQMRSVPPPTGRNQNAAPDSPSVAEPPRVAVLAALATAIGIGGISELRPARDAVVALYEERDELRARLQRLADEMEFIFAGNEDYCSETGPNDAAKVMAVVDPILAYLAKVQP